MCDFHTEEEEVVVVVVGWLSTTGLYTVLVCSNRRQRGLCAFV